MHKARWLLLFDWSNDSGGDDDGFIRLCAGKTLFRKFNLVDS